MAFLTMIFESADRPGGHKRAAIGFSFELCYLRYQCEERVKGEKKEGRKRKERVGRSLR